MFGEGQMSSLTDCLQAALKLSRTGGGVEAGMLGGRTLEARRQMAPMFSMIYMYSTCTRPVMCVCGNRCLLCVPELCVCPEFPGNLRKYFWNMSLQVGKYNTDWQSLWMGREMFVRAKIKHIRIPERVSSVRWLSLVEHFSVCASTKVALWDL